MDRVSEAIKKIDDLTKDLSRDKDTYTARQALAIVRKVLARSEPKNKS